MLHATTHGGQMPRALLVTLAASWLTFFGLGVWGHLELHNDLADSLFKSLQLFHLHHYPFPKGVHSGALPWTLQVARFGAGLWALALLPALLGLLFHGAVARWWVRRAWSGHYIVWGHCRRALNLVTDLAAEGRRVVFIGQCPVPQAQLPRRVVFMESGEDRAVALARARVQRAAHLVALNGDDATNLEVLVAAEKLSASRPRGEPPLDCAVHFADTHFQGGLYRTVVSQADARTARVRQHLFSYYDLVAGALVRSLPLAAVDARTAALPEHFVIVGFGNFGQTVARRLVRTGLQLHRDDNAWKVTRPRITVVDQRGEYATGAFLLANPQFADYCDLNTLELSSHDPRFLDLHFLQAGPPARRTTVLLCLWDETVTLRTALLLREQSRVVATGLDLIALRLADPYRLGSLLHQLDSRVTAPTHPAGPADTSTPPVPRIIHFAPDREVFTADALLHRSLDVLAREVHQAYLGVAAADARANNLAPAAERSWDELSEDDREGSREAADHTWAKLASLGFDLRRVERGQKVPAPDPALIEALQQTEEVMARLEHERWMAWRVLNGWQWGATRDNVRRLHPDIVDYDELAETTKDKDRVIVRAIPKLLREGRLRVVRAGEPSAPSAKAGAA